jgi:cytochrome P450
MALCCALANNPEVQKKAQAELDIVLGPKRLPLITDRVELPYLNAVVKELARWYTPAPVGTTSISLCRFVTPLTYGLALVHMNKEDDEYDGYFIPKGTTIFPNVW